jgi:hypothetical protein
MSFNYKVRFENGKLLGIYDDSRMTIIGIDFFERAMGYRFRRGAFKMIDLVNEDDPNFGAEGENGGWDGNRWENEREKDLFTLGVFTLNIPHRKWKYWNLQELSDKKTAKWSWGKFDLGWNQNMYFRLNHQEDQMCVVLAETILNNAKRMFALDRRVGNATEDEDWICIPREFVLTYNLQPNGDWVLDGPYCGPTQERCQEMRREEKILIQDQKDLRIKELARQKEEEKNKK